ncbi:SemiSWEET family transporter [Leuconostocaceae bacterium ESL0723]|nr:SemiSWEET family transporter [Lactobacillaceae bacterium L1_55_11]WEV53925.1 SemiSWEET family transporter [Leuconostocaceae bacterium ESL0723]
MTNEQALKFEKTIKYVSWVATVLAVLMYVSYIPQIQANLAGNKGVPAQPLVAALNCTLWTIYALFKRDRDYTIALANFPGIIFGLIAFFTAL